MNVFPGINNVLRSVADNPLLLRLAIVSIEVIILATLLILIIRAFKIRNPRIQALLWVVVLLKSVAGLIIGTPLPVFVFDRPPEVEVAPVIIPSIPEKAGELEALQYGIPENREENSVPSVMPFEKGGDYFVEESIVGFAGPFSETFLAPSVRTTASTSSWRNLPVADVLTIIWLSGVAAFLCVLVLGSCVSCSYSGRRTRRRKRLRGLFSHQP